MLYTKSINQAMRLCYKAHDGQVDKAEIPYVFHSFHLAEQMPDENTTIVALLHDVVEDTGITIEDLRKEGFSEEILEAISVLTHPSHVPYFKYIERIKDNPIARIVKIADLQHNSDLSRLEKVTEKDETRLKKYKQALSILSEE